MKIHGNVSVAQILPSLSLNLLSGTIVGASYLLQALLFTQVIMGSHALSSDTAAIVALLAINVLLRSALIGFRAVQTEKLAATVRTHLRLRLFRPLLTPGFDIIQRHSAAKLQSTLVEGVEIMEGFYSQYLPALLLALLCGTLTTVTLALFDPLSGVLLLTVMVANPLIDHLFLARQRQHIVGVFAAMQQFANELMDAMHGMLTLKAFNAAPRFRAKIAGRASLLRHESMSAMRVAMMRSGISRFTALTGAAGLLILNAFRVVREDLDPAILLLTLFITWEAFRPILQLETVFHTRWTAQGMQPAIVELTNAETLIHPPRDPRALPDSNTLHFDAITFSWPHRSRPLFRNLTLTLAENQHTAIIGPSGSGKSTLFQLMMRFTVPEKGRICFGGVPINELSVAALRSRMSWVSQQIFLTHGTLADNLRLGCPDATDQALWHVLHLTQLAEWACSLPERLNTFIGENGGRLSGGQRQRLAIARALLKRSPVLILDEITSNLDAANEAAIQRTIASLAGKCTLISIAHRLNTIAQADHIVVLQEGEIIEQGSPERLLLTNGYYASLNQSRETA